VLLIFTACQKNDQQPQTQEIQSDKFPSALSHTKKYSSKVATDWVKFQLPLTKTTPGFGPGTTGRAFAYIGLSLYESVVAGMPSYQSYIGKVAGINIAIDKKKDYYWPASANAAMAEITRNLFSAASAQDKASIDAYETANYNSYQFEASADDLASSAAYGKAIAKAVFSWAQSDGFLTAVAPPIPARPAFWVPTAPFFAPPAGSDYLNTRSFAKDVIIKTQPGAPIAYSADPSSAFYAMADEVYQESLNLSTDDINLAKTWADIPGNFNGQAHFTNVLTQILVDENVSLETAAYAYARHGMAIYDAALSCFRTKYTYFLVRPITYIRTVMGHPSWNTIIPTPPHPEYSAAHATISGASATILESLFGENYSFTDHTHENLYGARSYSSFREYAYQSGWSRVLAGVHYKPSVLVGLAQGAKVGLTDLEVPLKK